MKGSRTMARAGGTMALLALAGCATPPPTTASVAGHAAVAARPSFGSYKDVTVHRDAASPAMRVAVDGPPVPLLQALPPAQPSVTWAFATGECGQETWGGVDGASFAAANVPAFVAGGRHYAVSTGGQAGQFTCASDAAFERFLQTYASPMLEGVDFDIEGSQTEAAVDALAQRIAAARPRHPGLRWSVTIATLGGDRARSLAPIGDLTLAALRRHGLLDAPEVVVNLMVMDYGPATPASCIVGADGRCDMGLSAVHAAERLHADWGVPWSRIELTPMIGGNDTPDQAFRLRDVDTMSAFVRAHGLAGVRFWSVDRDVDCPPGPASNVCNTVGDAGPWGYTNRFLAQLGYRDPF
jgi:hypothetical protein